MDRHRGDVRLLQQDHGRTCRSQQLARRSRPFPSGIGQAYQAYRKALLSKATASILPISRNSSTISSRTRKLQPPLPALSSTSWWTSTRTPTTFRSSFFSNLSARTGNLCVVGDEDQSLYRFRGATVRNILEFPSRVPTAQVSSSPPIIARTRRIIEAYDRWMASADWSNPHGVPFRYDKSIEPDPDAKHPTIRPYSPYGAATPRTRPSGSPTSSPSSRKRTSSTTTARWPCCCTASGRNTADPTSAALEAKGIPAFCPTARAYFDNEEVRLMVGCFALIFGYHGEGRGEISGPEP